MKITVLAIGKIKEKYFSDAVEEYVKRCSRFADVKVTELPEAPSSKSPAEQVAIESEELLKKAKGFIIALDKSGGQLDSEEFSRLIDKKFAEGAGEMTFLIGGSHGHSEALINAADLVLSFSRFTFPHQLFRVVLLEQIYRALTIKAGTEYHK